MLRILLTALCILCAATLHAQTVFNGRVLENKTSFALRGVTVVNLANKHKIITGDDGRFSITAKTGDLLVLKTFGYQTDTLLLTDIHDRDIFMEPQRMELNQVTITDSSTKELTAAKSMAYYDPEFHGQTMVYHRNKEKQFDGGIILRMYYFKGVENQKKKADAKAHQRLVSEEISNTFTAENISRYLPLKGADLDHFLLLYTPDTKIYTKGFNLAAYLNACYKTWLTLTPEQRKAGLIFDK